jgi:2-polyprenylphenol hydroxylase and related flavodoxin oxidoreductases
MHIIIFQPPDKRNNYLYSRKSKLMEKKQIIDFHLLEKEDYGKSVWMQFGSDSPLPKIGAGQFLQVRIDASPSTYLRRPISIHDIDIQKNEISLLVQRVGEGSNHLASLPIGSMVNMILPLGNTFTIPEFKTEKIILIGGGIGIAPLFFLGKAMNSNNIKPFFLLGGKSKTDLLRLKEYEKLGKVFMTTEDGSLGEKGFVTQHSIWDLEHFDKIYVCGPKPMMKAVAAIAKAKDIWCEVSLENQMACGLGACLCCVEKTDEGHQCVCTEGPIFNATKLLW